MKKKTETLLSELISVFNNNSPTEHKAVEAYGRLGVTIGATLAGLNHQQLPSLEELTARFEEKHELGIGLLITGIMIISKVNPAFSDERKGKKEQGEQE